MCLYTKDVEPRIARRNIRVWKEVSWFSRNSMWVPPIYSYAGELEYNKILAPYNLLSNEKVQHLKVILDKDYFSGMEEMRIEQGFHAYRKIKHGELTLKIAIIPRGYEYCVGLDNDIVSSQIIVFKDFWDYIKWRLFR